VTAIQRQVAGEVAIGHVDGLLSRREALRGLGLLGVGAFAASPLIAACGEKTPAASPAEQHELPRVSAERPSLPCVYNWKASNTGRLRASLDGATNKRVNHVFIGDSITAGYLGGSENPQYNALIAWPRVYRSALQAQGIPVAGTGLVPCISGDAPYDPRWTRSGGWDASLAYMVFVRASGETATFVSDTPGTEVSVYYFGNSAGMKINVDGGSDSHLPMDGVAHANVHTVTGLPNTAHTVVITTTTAEYNQMVGASTQGGDGLVCHNIAVGGATASGPKLAAWATTTPGYINPALVGALTAASIIPDVVYVALGGNDIQDGYSTSQIVTALTTLRNQFASSDVIIIGENEFDGYQSVWRQWSSALHALADTLDCPLVDLYVRYGEYSNAVANRLMGDGAHLNAKAQSDIGTTIASLASSSH
jgi:lysophospholipase L1-like esterase